MFCATLPPVNSKDQIAQVRDAARKLLASAYLGGLDFNAVVKILKDAERDITQGRHKEAS